MKGKVLCAIGAVMVVLGIAAAVVFGSDPPRRVTLTDIPGTGNFKATANFALDFQVDPSTGSVVPLWRQKDIDVVIDGDINLEGTLLYHDGDRLTSQDGKLVHQSWYQIARNDIRYWAYRARKKITGKN